MCSRIPPRELGGHFKARLAFGMKPETGQLSISRLNMGEEEIKAEEIRANSKDAFGGH